MHGAQVPAGQALGRRPLPDHGRQVVTRPELVVHQAPAAVHLGAVQVHPDRPVWRHQLVKHTEPVAHHGQPDRVLQGIVVGFERLARVERRVDIDLLDLAAVPRRILRDAAQGAQRVVGIAEHQEVIRNPPWPGIADGADFTQEPDFRNPRVITAHPLVPAPGRPYQRLLFPHPGKHQPVTWHHLRTPSHMRCPARGIPLQTVNGHNGKWMNRRH